MMCHLNITLLELNRTKFRTACKSLKSLDTYFMYVTAVLAGKEFLKQLMH